MPKYPLYLLIATVIVGCAFSLPVSQTKDIEISEKTVNENFHLKLRHLEQLLKDLEKEETLIDDEPDEHNANEDKSHDHLSEHDLLKQLKANNSPEDSRENLEDDRNKAQHKDSDEEDVKEDRLQSTDNYQHERDAAMEKFLQSLSPESFKDLEDLRTLVEEAEQRDKKKIAEQKHYEGFVEHALTDSEEKEANWQNIMKEVDTQRDQNNIKNKDESEDKKKAKTHTFEGVFGKYTDEVRQAVEKNLLSDVALAMHSGLSIDDIINDILGKNKAANM